MDQHLKCIDGISRLREELDLYDQRRIPNGCKPLTMGYQCAQLDSATGVEPSLHLDFEMGPTCRELKETMFFKVGSSLRNVDIEIALAQKAELKDCIQPDVCC